MLHTYECMGASYSHILTYSPEHMPDICLFTSLAWTLSGHRFTALVYLLQERYVVCQIKDTGIPVAIENCDPLQVAAVQSYRPCQKKSCALLYELRTGHWSTCSSTCSSLEISKKGESEGSAIITVYASSLSSGKLYNYWICLLSRCYWSKGHYDADKGLHGQKKPSCKPPGMWGYLESPPTHRIKIL